MGPKPGGITTDEEPFRAPFFLPLEPRFLVARFLVARFLVARFLVARFLVARFLVARFLVARFFVVPLRFVALRFVVFLALDVRVLVFFLRGVAFFPLVFFFVFRFAMRILL
ncbi:MAG: hypothetical protein H6714_03680 [Myxococcales bacterium]|nr:hypothetical protein [Myxococcales bacterium]